MNIKGFFVDALSSALELGIGTAGDVVRHVTPDVLASHLPRPLWARLFTACLGAPRVDAQLVVETIGIPNLCEHIPASIIWACINEIGARSLGKAVDVPVAPEAVRITAPAIATSAAVLAPPPDERPAPPPAPAAQPVAIGPSIPAPAPVNQPLSDLISELEAGDSGSEPRLAKLRPRSPTAERFRQSNTAVGRLTGRRPQAAATPVPRRSGTEIEPEQETAVSEGADWSRRSNGGGDVDDSGLVEWKADGAPLIDDDFSDLGRKR